MGEFIWIHFNGSTSRQQVQFILENNGPLVNLLDEENITPVIKNIMSIVNVPGLKNDILISSYMNSLLNKLMLQSLSNESGNLEIPHMVNETVKIIESEFCSKLLRDNLASKLYIDKYHLIRKFKKYLGITTHEYLMQYRIKRAKSLLEFSSLSISEAALAVGIEDASYFSKVFRRIEKNTPAEYRKLWSLN